MPSESINSKLSFFKTLLIIVSLLLLISAISRGLIFDVLVKRITGNVGNSLFDSDIILVKTNYSKLQIGDIIIYENPTDSSGSRIARILDIKKNGVIANHKLDKEKPIQNDKIQGIASYILYSPSRSLFFVEIKEGNVPTISTENYSVQEKQNEKFPIKSKQEAIKNITLNSKLTQDKYFDYLYGDFSITNKNTYQVKDLVITCLSFSKTNTEIDKLKKIIYEFFPADKTIDLKNLKIGLMNSETHKANCTITDLTFSD